MKKYLLLAILVSLFYFSSMGLGPLSGSSGVCIGDSAYISESDSLLGGGTWTSSNPAVAAITSTGWSYAMIQGISAGTATITYTLGPSYVTKSFTVSGPLPAPISGISTLCIGGTTTLSDATPGGTWISYNTARATINPTTGFVTCLSGGLVAIAYSMGPSCAVWITFTVDYTFTGYIVGLPYVCVGSTITLSNPADSAMTGTWSSSNPAIATIDPTGIVSGISAGTVTISYTCTGSCGTASATKTVTVSSTTTPGTITGPSTVNIGSEATLGGYYGTWSSSNPAVATIGSSNGKVMGLSIGTTTITHTVTGCGGPASITTPISVVAFNGISGRVLFSGAPYSGQVKIYLIHFDPATNMLSALDSTTKSSAGGNVFYQFLGVGTDSFRIKAAALWPTPDSTGTGYMPTYHTSNFYWHDADVLYHTTGTYDINQNIDMAYGTWTSGPGFIAGNVLTGANKGTAGTAPAKGVHVCVLNENTHIIMKYAYTDASGYYSFDNLPVGETYYVFPDSLNYLTTPYSGIELTAGNPSVTDVKFTMHTVSRRINPFAMGTIDIQNKPAISFTPNPCPGNLVMHWDAVSPETATLTLYDVAGSLVYEHKVSLTNGAGTFNADISGLSDGCYIVNVISTSLNYYSKIQVQH